MLDTKICFPIDKFSQIINNLFFFLNIKLCCKKFPGMMVKAFSDNGFQRVSAAVTL